MELADNGSGPWLCMPMPFIVALSQNAPESMLAPLWDSSVSEGSFRGRRDRKGEVREERRKRAMGRRETESNALCCWGNGALVVRIYTVSGKNKATVFFCITMTNVDALS